ncbi:hypothetical protein HFO56_23050 [Rhizobium laguerreae]|uniref:hypothetical protein n=1 Tax=Rhizobium laguerreae TaxID=1076926 RepID=UPI001C901EAB|nr:hypothetical protein [Rhizobium laguerreae]MBY3155203.1 hypothetical protein [Rhizobium laguerreae]
MTGEIDDAAGRAKSLETEPLTEVGKLFEKHIAVAKMNLNIAQCFSAMRDFETRIGKLNGVRSLHFEPGPNRGGIAAGTVRLQLGDRVQALVAGHWNVTDNGYAIVEFPGVTISSRGHQFGMELKKLLWNGTLKLIIDRVTASADDALFLPDFGNTQTA